MNETPVKQSILAPIHSILEHNPEFSIEHHLFSDLLSSKRRNIDNTYFYQPDGNASKIFSLLLNKITYYESVSNLNSYYISLPDLAIQTKTGLGTVKRKILKLKNLNWIDVQIKRTSKGSTLCHFSINPSQVVNDFNEYNLRIGQEKIFGIKPDINAPLDDITEVDSKLLQYQGKTFNDETFAEYESQEEAMIGSTTQNQDKHSILFAHILFRLDRYNIIKNTKSDTVCLDYTTIATSLSWSVRTIQRQVAILKQKELITTIIKHNSKHIPQTYFTIKTPSLIIESINLFVKLKPIPTLTIDGIVYTQEEIHKLVKIATTKSPKALEAPELPAPKPKKQHSKFATSYNLAELKEINLQALAEFKQELLSKPIDSQYYINSRDASYKVWDKELEIPAITDVFKSIEIWIKDRKAKNQLSENANIEERFKQFFANRTLAWVKPDYNAPKISSTPDIDYSKLFEIKMEDGWVH